MMSAAVHYKVRWPDDEVPEGEPTWLYYEVDPYADVVTRTVDTFADGRIRRNSIALEERNGDSCPSLVDGSFKDLTDGVALEEIASVEFDDLWNQGTDRPFWFPAEP